MRIILVGKHELACKIFKLLEKDRRLELGVITTSAEDEKLEGRETLKRILKKEGWQALNRLYSHKELMSIINNFVPDLVISAGFDKIFTSKELALVPLAVNVHFSLLPKYRGMFSIPWAIINGEEFIGVTLHKIDTGIDSGDIIFQRRIANDKYKSCRQLYSQACAVGVDLIREFIDNRFAGKLPELRAQNPKEATYFKEIVPKDFAIDFRKPTLIVYNHIRALYFPPYDGAYTNIGGLKVSIEFPVAYRFKKHNLKPATILAMPDGWWVATVDGFIIVNKIVVGRKRYTLVGQKK